MSDESKFLKWQDPGSDGLNDVCDDLIDVTPTNKCPTCQPNPNYIAPNWRKRESFEPWINEKTCTYQIALLTSVGSLPEDVDSVFEEYVDEAIEGLLVGFDKADTVDSRQAVRDAIEFQQYDLDARPMSYLRLLYSIGWDEFANLPDTEQEDDDEENDDEDENQSGPTVVEMEADYIKEKLIRFRKAMNLYSRYYRVYSFIEDGALVFTETNKLFSVRQFDRYGDAGLMPTSTMAQLLIKLNAFLNNKGLNIFGVGNISIGRDRVTKIEFKFSKDYRLRRMRVWTQGCGDKPKVYGKKRLKPLTGQSSWKDKTAVGYFAKLNDIDNKLSARQALHWIDIVKEFTYPEIHETFSFPPQESPEGPETALSCMGDALASSLGNLGQDIMDEVLGIGDAIAYQFHNAVCQNSMGEFQEQEKRLGFVIDPETFNEETGKMGQPRNLTSMAVEQAFKKLADDEQVFVNFCASVMSGFSGVGFDASAMNVLDNIYAEGLDRIKLCGLFDLMMDAINCLLGGLSLEDAMARIIKAALRGMNIDNLGDFFIGLPPDKQMELEALVTQKIESGDVFKNASGPAADGGAQVVSDTVTGKLKWSAPWKNRTSADPESPSGGNSQSGRQSPLTLSEQQQTSELTRRTLAQQFDIQGNAEDELSPNVVLEAYILALIDVYSDDLLSVLDMLNKYPGAQMIAKVIAMFDCPRPPIFNPSVLDFIKDLSIPWCRSQGELTLPMLFNPFGWIPKIEDITALLWYALKIAIQRALIAILAAIIVKICELIGDALCKALEVMGDLAASLPAVIGGKTTFREVIRDSICGDSGASDEQIDDTIAEMFERLGVGGAALADKQAVIDFTEDLSSATTRRELMDAFLGNSVPAVNAAAYNIIQFEYPQFADAFPNQDAVGDFIANCGSLMPPEVHDAMQNFVDGLPDDDMLPANPSLCASPDQLENFQELRCSLLEGRATPEQCKEMFDNLQDDLGEDLESLMGSIQQGIMPMGAGPGQPIDSLNGTPFISKPGCDDGMLPYESDEQKNVAKIALGSELKSLKKDYAEDMLGNGGLGTLFGADKGWGLMNMVLSDTMGQPLTAHWRKAANRPAYVDFVSNGDEPDANKVFLFFSDPAPTVRQRGNFPEKVASYLQSELNDLSADFDLNNSWKNKTTKYRSFEDLGFEGGLFSGDDINRLSIPDFGYNYSFISQVNNSRMKIVRHGRKKNPDIKLEYRDNNKGRDGFAYGFNLKMYTADLAEGADGVPSNVGSFAEPVDATRIMVTNVYNPAKAYRVDLKNTMTEDQWDEYLEKVESRGSDKYVYDRLFEFSATSDTLSNINPVEFPQMCACFQEQRPFSPIVYGLGDLVMKHNPGVAEISYARYERFRQKINVTMDAMFSVVSTEIAENDTAFMFGAKYDTLSEEDAEYVLKDGQLPGYSGGTLYEDAEIEDEEDDEMRSIRNSDMILGVSRDQHEKGDKDARIFYLDPGTYGGSYSNPAVYIKPLQYEGYLGMVNVMFPEFSPCKPRSSDLVDFGTIEKEISDTYNQIPEDQRLKSDPDCVTEVPFNRILNRPAKAGIQGLIRSACRIYASTHFLKSFATFSLFKPDYTNLFGPVFPQYVVENMERSFRDAQGAFWEFFNTFKDDEFWYAFLEQAVQTYGRLVDSGEIVNPPEHVLQALFRINDAQENYHYPRITDNKNDVKRANKILETDAPYRWPLKKRGLKTYREEKNLEAVQAMEEDAKIILNEFMIQELDYMGQKFTDNLKSQMGITPKYNDIAYYIFSKMCQGATDLDLDKEIIEEPVGIPTEGDGHYTAGGEFSQEDGTPYVGYFHVHTDDDNNLIYMQGEFHASESHPEIYPYANKIMVPIGNVANIGTVGSTPDPGKPFILEKYININGSRLDPDTAVYTVRANDPELNISDVYPGTMQQVVDPVTGQVVGIEGELGVRQGIMFSMVLDGVKYTLASAEIDALDLKVSQMPPFTENSKLLLCLLNKLKEDDDFKFIINYLFPFNKVLSMLAIYNDMGFLSSIGEETVASGDTKPSFFPTLAAGPTFESKPGAKVEFDGDGNPDYSASNPKWASVDDRSIFTPFNLDWDDWDQMVLRNSKSRIKKLFKMHYYSRDFTASDAEGTDFTSVFVKNLKASFQPPTGKRIFPWFKRKNIRDNPFNSKGELCKKHEK